MKEKKELTKQNLLMWIRMTILGLKCNLELKKAGFGKLGQELEDIFNDTFKEEIKDGQDKNNTKTIQNTTSIISYYVFTTTAIMNEPKRQQIIIHNIHYKKGEVEKQKLLKENQAIRLNMINIKIQVGYKEDP